MRNTIKGYNPKTDYAKVTTKGTNLNYKTNWSVVKDTPFIFLNKSVIELTSLGYNITRTQVNHSKKLFVIIMTNRSNSRITAYIPLESITDVSKIVKRTNLRCGKVKTSFIDIPKVEKSWVHATRIIVKS